MQIFAKIRPLNNNVNIYCENVLLKLFCSFILVISINNVSSLAVTIRWCGGENKELPLIISDVPDGISERNETFSIRIMNDVVIPCNVSSSLFEIDLNPPIRKPLSYPAAILSSGHLRVQNFYFPSESFCIKDWENSVLKIQLCAQFTSENDSLSTSSTALQGCGTDYPCIPKCCAVGKLGTFSSGASTKLCQMSFEASRNIFEPAVYSLTSKYSRTNKSIYYFRNGLKCEHGIYMYHHWKRSVDPELNATIASCFRILEDGTLFLRPMKGEWTQFPIEEYCVDGFQFERSLLNKTDLPFLGEEDHYGVIVCAPEPQNFDAPIIYSILYGSAIFAVSIFPLLTFLVYALLWKEQRIQGWNTMSHTATMFFMYFSLGANHILVSKPENLHEVSGKFHCKALGILTHYFFLSNFCWLTAICFSLFWTFRSLNNLCTAQETYKRQYFLYAAFGWGAPFLFVMVSYILDIHYSNEPCSTVLVAEYGQVTCTISEGALGPYLYFPVAILLVLNLIFFCITSYKLYGYKKSVKMARENIQDSQQLFLLIVKLFFVMGFTWIFEFLSWWHSHTEKKWYWAVMDMVNCLQAVAIFVIYVCKLNVMEALKANYPKLKPFLTFNGIFGKPLENSQCSTLGSRNDRQNTWTSNVQLSLIAKN